MVRTSRLIVLRDVTVLRRARNVTADELRCRAAVLIVLEQSNSCGCGEVERPQHGTCAVDEGVDDFGLGRAEIEAHRQAAVGPDAGSAIGIDHSILLGLREVAECGPGL